MPAAAILRAIFRVSGWRQFPVPAADPHPGFLVALALLSTMATALFDWALSDESWSFQLYGVNSALLGSAVVAALAGMFAPPERRSIAIAVVFGLSTLSSLALTGIAIIYDALAATRIGEDFPPASWLWVTITAITIVWSSGAIATTFRSLASGRPIRALSRAIGMIIGISVISTLLPNWPTFTGKDFSKSTANIWELISAATASDDPDPGWVQREELSASIEMAQPTMLRQAIDGLASRQEAESNIFVLGVAGSNSETVFATEIKASLGILDQRFKTKDRSILLVNSLKTFPSIPAASIANMSAAIRAIGERMDKERDTVVLVLTSHGDKTGFTLDLGSIVRRSLTPFTLKSMLDAAEIKNRIVIVSACYSGIFVPELADENTVVITASSATTNSFGCSNEREWTYFGDAFFNQALRAAPTLSAAFEQAKILISEWEEREGLTPSQPQIHIGAAIGRKFPFIGTPASKLPDSSAAMIGN